MVWWLLFWGFFSSTSQAGLVSDSLLQGAGASANTVRCAQQVMTESSAQYLFIGEDHTDLSPEDLFLELLPRLKELGYTDVFFEHIESKDQFILDRLETERDNHFVLGRLQMAIEDWGYDYDKYFKITIAGYVFKYGVHGLDRRADLRFMIDDKERMAIRDKHMFLVAKDYIDKNPDKKIIFFNGWSHSFNNDQLKSPSFYELFTKYYGASKTMNLKVDPAVTDLVSLQRLDLSGRHAVPDYGCESGFFFYKDQNAPEFDYYLFRDGWELLPIQDHGTVFI